MDSVLLGIVTSSGYLDSLVARGFSKCGNDEFPLELLKDLVVLCLNGYQKDSETFVLGEFEFFLQDFLFSFQRLEDACLFRNSWASTVLHTDVYMFYESSFSEGQFVPGPDKMSSRFWRLAYSLMNTVTGVKSDCCEAIWNTAKKAFRLTLGQYYDTLMRAASWVHEIWDNMKSWCESIIKELAAWMEGFKECLSVAMGVVGIASVLILLDKFLLNMGLTSHTLNLGTGFVLVVLGYLGIKEGGFKVGSCVGQMISRLVAACQGVVTSIGRSFNVEGSTGAAESNAQMNPISLLETFAAALGNVSSQSIVSTGRVFGAVTQISKGCETMWSCCTKICEFLWDLLDKGFGIKSKALSDVSGLVGCDIQSWLKRCDAACEYMNWNPALSQEILFKFRTLKAHGVHIRDSLLGRQNRGTSMVITTVCKALEKLQELLDAAVLAGQGGPRREPFWIAFCGDAGVGKSTVVTELVKRYQMHKGLERSDVYCRNPSDKYWSNYRRQTVVVWDDLGALSGSTLNEEGEFLRIVSRNPLALEMARLEEKGMYFDSSMLITSSNFKRYSPKAEIHEPQAYLRRRSMLIEVKYKDNMGEGNRDPSNAVGHQKYTLLERMDPFNRIKDFDTFEDLYAFFLTEVERHERKEDELMQQLSFPDKPLVSQIGGLGELIAVLSGPVPSTVKDLLAKHSGWSYLTTVDEKIYLWNVRGELMTLPLDTVDASDAEFLQKDSLRVALNFGNVLRSIPTLNPLAAHYISDLVTHDCFDANLDVNKAVERVDVDLYSVALGIPRWQRAHLRSLAKSCSAGGKGIFSFLYQDLCTRVKTLHISDIRTWPMCVKLGLGLIVALTLGRFVFTHLAKIAQMGSGTSMSLAALGVMSMAQSDDGLQSGQKVAMYRGKQSRDKNMTKTKGEKYNAYLYNESFAQGDGAGHEFLMQKCLATFEIGDVSGQLLLLPGRRLVGVAHLLRLIPDKCLVRIETEDQKYYIVWHKACYRPIDDSELAVYTHGTVREIPASVADRIHFGFEGLPNQFEAMFCSCKKDPISGEYIPEVGRLDVQKRTKSLGIWYHEYTREISQCLEYQVITHAGDCGSLLIAKIGTMDKIVGIHVAGANGRGQACFIPAELELSAGQSFLEDVKLFPVGDPVGDGLKKIGLIKPEKSFFMPAKTSYKQTPDEWHLGFPCDRLPSVLSKGDIRLKGTENENYDPYIKGMEKYSEECGPFEEVPLIKVCDDILGTMKDVASHYSFDPVSIHEAIVGIQGVDYMNPLVMSTSEGWPFVLERQRDKGKHRYFEENDGQIQPTGLLQVRLLRLEEECAHRVPQLVGLECAKDEKLPVKKVLTNPKTRLFTILPLDYNLLVRMKFLRFVRFIMKNRDVLPCQVGINPYGREWGRLANRLQSQGDSILCCDYSRFDGILCKQVMNHIANLINALCGGDERLKRQRKNLLLACCSRFAIADGRVWIVENGIPSGFPLTVIVNSIFNEIIVRYLYRQCFYEQPMLAASFDQYVSLITFGDDNLISISPTICSHFHGQYIQQQAAVLKIKITDGVDKDLDNLEFRTLSTCDFLKRGFKKDDFGRWRAPIELSSLWSQLHWVKCDELDMQTAFLVNAESVLRELFIHSESQCKAVRDKLLGVSWIRSKMLPTLDQLRAFHEVQMEVTLDNATGSQSLLRPDMLGPIAHNKEQMDEFTFKNLCATTTFLYKRQSGDFVVSLGSITVKDCDMKVLWDAAFGRGELPTSEWLVRNFIGDNCNILKKLKTAYADGRRIVFVTRTSNVYSMIFLVLFGWKAKILHPTESNLMVSKAISLVRSLGYLKDAFPQLLTAKVGSLDYSSNFAFYKKWTVFDFQDFPLDRDGMRECISVSALKFEVAALPSSANLDATIENRLEYCRSKNFHGVFFVCQVFPEEQRDLVFPSSVFNTKVELIQGRKVDVSLTMVVYDGASAERFTICGTCVVNGPVKMGDIHPSPLKSCCAWFCDLVGSRRKRLEDGDWTMAQSSYTREELENMQRVSVISGRIPKALLKKINELLPYHVGRNRIWIDTLEFQLLQVRGLALEDLDSIRGRVMPGKIDATRRGQIVERLLLDRS